MDVGQMVFVTNPATSTGDSTKLRQKFKGPRRILKRVSGDTYQVQDLYTNYVTNFHISQFRNFVKSLQEDDDEISVDSVD